MSDRDTVPPRESRERRTERRRSYALRATLRKFRDSIHKRFTVIGDAVAGVREDTARALMHAEATEGAVDDINDKLRLLLEGQQALTKLFTEHIEDRKVHATQQPEERASVD